mgnify:CR=1 FL=1
MARERRSITGGPDAHIHRGSLFVGVMLRSAGTAKETNHKLRIWLVFRWIVGLLDLAFHKTRYGWWGILKISNKPEPRKPAL